MVIVEAGAGYGKTTLAAELVHGWNAVPVEVTLHEGGVSAALLVAHLRAALVSAGFSDAVAAMTDAGYDPHAAVDAAVASLTGEPAAIVIDDAQHADRDAGVLIDRIAQRVAGSLRLVVLARHLPDGCQRLRRAEFAQLGPDDLELAADETLEMCRTGFGLEVGADDAAVLHSMTAGWTAATVLAAARARRTGESVTTVAQVAGSSRGRESAVAAILDEAMVALSDEDRAALAQIARVPQLDRAAVDLIRGEPGFLERAALAGVPFTSVGPDEWALPGPVKDFFAARAPADATVLRQLADSYAGRGELSAALQLLVSADAAAVAAALLAEASPAQLDGVDLHEFESVIDRLDAATTRHHPQLLLHLARLYDSAGQFDQRTVTLDRLDRVIGEHDDPALLRAAGVERTIDLMRTSQYDDVEAGMSRFLDDDQGTDAMTRARALSGMARAVCWRSDALGQRDEAAMRRSDRYFGQAESLYRSIGLHTSAAAMVPYRAMWIDHALGNSAAALARIDAGLTEIANRPRKWAYLLSFRSEVLIELSRYDEAEAWCLQSIAVGDRFGDEQLRAFAYWNQAIIASHLGDADRVLALTRQVEQHPGEWFEPVSGDFLGDSADNLDRVGHTALASEYLARAQARPMDGGPMIAMAEAAILARHGDPDHAERCLSEVFTHNVDPRERWRVMLMRAYAALRRGDPGAGAMAARAFDLAAAIGIASLPLTKERDITQALLALAVETGQPAAVALQATALPTVITLLGRFAVTRGGRPLPIAAGQSAQLVKLLAVSGGRLATERVIDALWPDADLDAGRNRLRTVLNRLRADAGDLVDRSGEVLSLAAEIRVDLDDFGTEARQALALGEDEPALAVGLARAALARYRGELLPDDPYEPWSERPREAAQRLALELLDLCADVAARQGDLDEVRRLVERTIDLAPYDDERYLRAATALLEQGRRGAALAVVARARAALAELGLPPPLDLVRIEKLVVA